MDYLQGNRDTLISFINERIPQLKVIIPEATYLVWMDCSSLGIGSEELCNKIFEEGFLRINNGHTYGDTGDGFIRMNIACPRALLIEGLERLERVVKSLHLNN